MIKSLEEKLFKAGYDGWSRHADNYSVAFMFPNNMLTRLVRLLSHNNRKTFIARLYFYYTLSNYGDHNKESI